MDRWKKKKISNGKKILSILRKKRKTRRSKNKIHSQKIIITDEKGIEKNEHEGQ